MGNCPDFGIQTVNSVLCELKSSSYLGPKILEILPLDLKQTKSYCEFKSKIKKWNPVCMCVSAVRNISFSGKFCLRTK